MDLQGAILTLAHASLSDIAAEMPQNENELTTATKGLTQALQNITKTQSILNSIT